MSGEGDQNGAADELTQLAPLEALTSAGFSIALDSFGLSRNALEALLVLAPKWLKCEVRLVRGCDTDAGKRRTLQRLVTIAERMGMTLVAVGVETEGELQVLRELGIQRVQGYLFGEPSELVDVDR